MACLGFPHFRQQKLCLKNIKNKYDVRIFFKDLHKTINLSESKCQGNHENEGINFVRALWFSGDTAEEARYAGRRTHPGRSNPLAGSHVSEQIQMYKNF